MIARKDLTEWKMVMVRREGKGAMRKEEEQSSGLVKSEGLQLARNGRKRLNGGKEQADEASHHHGQGCTSVSTLFERMRSFLLNFSPFERQLRLLPSMVLAKASRLYCKNAGW